jgi:BlaI family penicillinase repressor
VSDPKVTEAEAVVLGPLWRLGPLTPARLIAEVKLVQPWADTTIKTLLARLVRKAAVTADRANGPVRYRPMIARDDFVAAEVRILVERLFDGDEEALIAFLKARRVV